MLVLVDTSVVVRIANGPLDAQYQVAESALELVRRAGHRPAVVPQVLYEFWSVATRPRQENGLGFSIQEAAMELDRLGPPLFVLLQDERSILPRWRDLVRDYSVLGKTCHDARLVAAMLRHGMHAVMTFNTQHFTRFREILAYSPTDVVDGRWSL